jgi:glycosyltransferase involved in cell wall biosynthesis
MRKVLIIQPWIPQYRVDFFRQLRQICEQNAIILDVIAPLPPLDFQSRGDYIIDPSIYTTIKAKRVNVFGRNITFYRIPIEYKFRNYDAVIMEQSLHALQLLYFVLNPAARKKLILWGHGKTVTKKKSLIEHYILRKITFMSAHFLSYTQEGRDYFIKFGMNSEKITILRNSNFSEVRINEIKKLENFGVLKNISNNLPNCIFVGALDPSKRLDFLADCLPHIAAQIPQFNLKIYGDGPLRRDVEVLCKKYDYVTYGGIATAQIINKLGQDFRLFLNPGRVGLLAVDSIILGIPIVTTRFDYHAPELEYVVSNDVVRVTENSVEAYVDGVVSLLKDPTILVSMRSKSSSVRDFYTIENMTLNFFNGLEKVLNDGESHA